MFMGKRKMLNRDRETKAVSAVSGLPVSTKLVKVEIVTWKNKKMSAACAHSYRRVHWSQTKFQVTVVDVRIKTSCWDHIGSS